MCSDPRHRIFFHVHSSFESQEELKQEIERLHTIARDNAAKHRVAAEADAADTLSIALDGGERVFIRDPKTACVESGDYFAHWWDDTGDERAAAGEKVPGWVDGKILRKRGNMVKGRWYVEYAVDEKTVAKGAVWHDFEPAAYGTDRSLGHTSGGFSCGRMQLSCWVPLVQMPAVAQSLLCL